jgi:myo-inositol-1-phosphate synthase
MLKPKVAIVGVGNCASVLIQGLDYYSKRKDGLWHPKVGGYTVSDISLSAAFDIDRRKVGLGNFCKPKRCTKVCQSIKEKY